jgi:hypothetical protein
MINSSKDWPKNEHKNTNHVNTNQNMCQSLKDEKTLNIVNTCSILSSIEMNVQVANILWEYMLIELGLKCLMNNMG